MQERHHGAQSEDAPSPWSPFEPTRTANGPASIADELGRVDRALTLVARVVSLGRGGGTRTVTSSSQRFGRAHGGESEAHLIDRLRAMLGSQLETPPDQALELGRDRRAQDREAERARFPSAARAPAVARCR